MDPTLYVVLDRAVARGRDLGDILDATVAAGCRLVQLREKEWPSGRLLPLARRLRARCREAGVIFNCFAKLDHFFFEVIHRGAFIELLRELRQVPGWHADPR